MAFCPECGTKIDGTPKFCPECGFKFGNTAPKKTPVVEEDDDDDVFEDDDDELEDDEEVYTKAETPAPSSDDDDDDEMEDDEPVQTPIPEPKKKKNEKKAEVMPTDPDDPSIDPYWDDVIAETEDELVKLPKEIMIKAIGLLVAVILVIAWLIVIL